MVQREAEADPGFRATPGPLPTRDALAVRVARIVPRTTAEGPGLRAAVWVQGCTIRCPGCFNPQFWGLRGGTAMTPEALLDAIPAAEVEGVTLLGGEPFEQAIGLAAFARLAAARGLGVMTFSGYRLDALQAQAASGVPGVADLLAATDLLIDGPYERDAPDLVRPWVGSTNQGFHTLTPRYRALQGAWVEIPDRLEVRVAADGSVAVNGWADTDTLDALLGGLRRRK